MFRNAVRKKSIARSIVAKKTTFSTPLRVRYTLPLPPKMVESPPPRCCIKMPMIKRVETMICIMVIVVCIEIYIKIFAMVIISAVIARE